MDKIKKKNRNQSYYLKNREKILEKANQKTKKGSAPSTNVVSLFEMQAPVETTRKQPAKRRKYFSLEAVFIGVLAFAITYFLFTESVKFYLAMDGQGTDAQMTSAYLKAFIVEGVVVAFSIMKGRTFVLNAIYKVLVAIVYLYSLWVVSGSTIQSSLHHRQEVSIQQKTIRELEEEILKTEVTRDRLWNRDRITLAGVYDRALNSMRLKLEAARKEMIQLPSSMSIWNTLMTLVCFRILITICNFFCLQHLSREFRCWGRMT